MRPTAVDLLTTCRVKKNCARLIRVPCSTQYNLCCNTGRTVRYAGEAYSLRLLALLENPLPVVSASLQTVLCRCGVCKTGGLLQPKASINQ